MADRGMKTVQHPPYSPNLTPCDFFLFPCMKESLERIRFHSAEKLKKSSEHCLMGSLMKDFQKNFQNRERHMKTCVDAGGSNFEGDQVLWAYGNKWCFSWHFLIAYWTYLVYWQCPSVTRFSCINLFSTEPNQVVFEQKKLLLVYPCLQNPDCTSGSIHCCR